MGLKTGYTERDLERLKRDYLSVFGDELESLILYGSAANGTYIKHRSDVNLLVTVTLQGMERLNDTRRVIRYWRKNRYATPLFMTRHFIQTSLDAYPIEFANMKNSHVLIFGADVLSDLEIQPEFLRLQIERELKAKLLLLRQGFVERGGQSWRLKRLISQSLTAITAILNAILIYRNIPVPIERKDTVIEIGKLLTIDSSALEKCVDLKEGRQKFSGQEVRTLFDQYLAQIAELSDIADSFKSN